MRLQARLSATIAALIAAFSLASMLFLYGSQRRQVLAEQERAREEAVRKLASVCRDAELSGDEIMLLNYIREVSVPPDVEYAAFVDAGGTVVMHTELRRKGRPMKDVAAAELFPDKILRRRLPPARGRPETLEYAALVEVGGLPAGVARLAFDIGRIEERLSRSLRLALGRYLVVALVCALLGLVVAHYTAAGLTRPLRVLMEGARRVGGGDFQARIPDERRDEIGELAGEFNGMAARLAELDELKDHFISTVSHDLRSPLCNITVFTDWLLHETRLDKEQAQIVESIARSSRRLTQMVTDILDFSKMKAGRMSFELKTAELKPLLEDALEQHRLTARKAEVALALEADGSPPAVRMDARHIHRVVTNLLSNALKFTPEGGKVSLEARREDGFAVVTVRDTGRGIPESEKPFIFQKFHQVSQTASNLKDRAGTGLGLAIARTVVEEHGGRMWFESEEGRGTAFHFSLPAAEEAPDPETSRGREP